MGLVTPVAFAARVALVVGNEKYSDSPLKNPVQDATDIGHILTKLGFNTTVKLNLDALGMQQALLAHEQKLQDGDTSLFYFAGHGVQIRNRNYLLPVNVHFDSGEDIQRKSLDLSDVMSRVQAIGNGTNLFFVDACRNNPFQEATARGTGTHGLADVGAPTSGENLTRAFAPTQSLDRSSGLVVAYSTGFGTVAYDGEGRNSVYATKFIEQLKQPGLSIERLLKNVRASVMEVTYAKQQPIMKTAITGELILNQLVTGSISGQQTLSSAFSSQAKPNKVAEYKDKLNTGGEGPVMVNISQGQFQMGGERFTEQPKRVVSINNSFSIMASPVTSQEYLTYVQSTGAKSPKDKGWGKLSPVVNITWSDAKAYASWLSKQTGQRYRLPTEAEWEYAARGGGQQGSVFWWGNDMEFDRNVNCRNCGSRWDNVRAAPVKSTEPNAFGLYDVIGNVWEWVEDCWAESYASAPKDGTATISKQCGNHVLRGGGWNTKANKLSSSARKGASIFSKTGAFGFRLMREKAFPLSQKLAQVAAEPSIEVATAPFATKEPVLSSVGENSSEQINKSTQGQARLFEETKVIVAANSTMTTETGESTSLGKEQDQQASAQLQVALPPTQIAKASVTPPTPAPVVIDQRDKLAVLPIIVDGQLSDHGDIMQGLIENFMRSGEFNVLLPTNADPANLHDASSQAMRPKYVITTQLDTLCCSQHKLNIQLKNTITDQQILSFIYPVNPDAHDSLANQLSDTLYHAITGHYSDFSSHIIMVTKVGAEYHINLNTADGKSTRNLLISPQPLTQVQWLPDGDNISYLAKESGGQKRYLQGVYTGERRNISSAEYKTLNASESSTSANGMFSVNMQIKGVQVNALRAGLKSNYVIGSPLDASVKSVIWSPVQTRF